MAPKIVWSERALSDLRNIIEYLEQHWTEGHSGITKVKEKLFRFSEEYLDWKRCRETTTGRFRGERVIETNAKVKSRRLKTLLPRKSRIQRD